MGRVHATCAIRDIFSQWMKPDLRRRARPAIWVGPSQWEMYSSSKHGVRYLLKESRVLPEDAAAPTCQSCHFQDGNHANRTAWGYLALRLPYPQDAQWARDRYTILQALGIFDPGGKPTPRLAAVETYKVIRFTEEDWQAERDKALKYCNDCHSINFARAELEKGDQMIREADALMAEGIRIVAALYAEGVLKKPENYTYAFPDLLMMHNAPTVIEQKLFTMFHEYRMRTFQGAFHCSPDYSFWYGWGPMQTGLIEIREQGGRNAGLAVKAAGASCQRREKITLELMKIISDFSANLNESDKPANTWPWYPVDTSPSGAASGSDFQKVPRRSLGPLPACMKRVCKKIRQAA